jgi:hypothetical protein
MVSAGQLAAFAAASFVLIVIPGGGLAMISLGLSIAVTKRNN